LPIADQPSFVDMLHLVLTSPLLSGFAGRTPHASRAARCGVASPCVMAAGNDAITFPTLDGSEIRVGIIKARWHDEIIDGLIDGAKASFKECGVPDDAVVEYEVPGSFELPLAARYMALSGQVDAILPVGVLIKGDTYHFEAIADSVSKSLMEVGLQTGIPVIFGVLTVNTEEQAKYRSEGSNNHGTQWGKAAVEMAMLRKSALGSKNKKFFLGFGEDPNDSSTALPKTTANPIGF